MQKALPRHGVKIVFWPRDEASQYSRSISTLYHACVPLDAPDDSNLIIWRRVA